MINEAFAIERVSGTPEVSQIYSGHAGREAWLPPGAPGRR